jgi:hypothetical protein
LFLNLDHQAQQNTLGVTGIVLSQGGGEAVRALCNLRVVVVNGDVSSSQATLFTTL